MDKDARERLARKVIDRRRELGLSVPRAIADVEISRPTWERVERGERIRDAGYAAIEKALRWSTGSVARILEGGEPGKVVHGKGSARLGFTATMTGEARPAPQDDGLPAELDAAVAEITELDLPLAEKLRMVRRVVAMYKADQRARAAQRETLDGPDSENYCLSEK